MDLAEVVNRSGMETQKTSQIIQIALALCCQMFERLKNHKNRPDYSFQES